MFTIPLYRALIDLSAEGGAFSGSITWRSVMEYCKELGLPQDYAEDMFDTLRLAQGTFSKWQESEKKRSST